MFENEPRKEQSLIGDGTGLVLDLEQRNSIHILLRDMKDCNHIVNELYSRLNDALNVYKREFCNYFKRYNENPKFINHTLFSHRPFEISDFDVQRVAPKTHFRWHTDGDGDGDYAHTCIIYLNDIDIKDGGATEFACGRKVQPKAGKILFFPGGWSNIHRGSFVHKPKYMITCSTRFIYPVDFPFLISGTKINKTPLYPPSRESQLKKDSQNLTLVRDLHSQ
jgi:hypothetical protein